MTAAVKAAAVRTNGSMEGGKFVWAEFSGASVTMDNSGDQAIFDLDTSGLTRIAIQLVVTTATLAAFKILAQTSSQGLSTTPVTLKSVAADYTSPSGLLIAASGDLTAQGVGSAGWFVLNCAGFPMIRITSNSTGAASGLAIWGSGV